MKTLIIKILFLGGLVFGLSGCYTVLWTPEDEFPTEENYSYDEYYGSDYYGEYYYYYEYPWWLTINPPAPAAVTKERGREGESLRNPGTGRGSGGRYPTADTPRPTRDSDSQDTGSTKPDNSQRTGSSNVKENSSTSSSSSSSSRSGSSSDNRSTRNNNGSRNSGGGRR